MKFFNANITQIFSKVFTIGILIVGVSSCSVAQNTARETDGVYYDPSTEPVQKKVVVVEDAEYKTAEPVYQYEEVKEEQPIRIGGKYFDDDGNAPETTETNSYKNSETFNDDRVVVHNNNAYDNWGEDEGVEIHINNYYTGFRPSFYYDSYWRPYRFRSWYRANWWGYGWDSWGHDPYFTSNFGWGNPYYGFAGYYGPLRPYYYGYGYHPYYAGYYGHPYYNGYYRNGYVRNIYRGRGNNNGVRINNSVQRTRRGNANANTPTRTRVRRTNSTFRPRRSRANENVTTSPRRGARTNNSVRQPRTTRSNNSTAYPRRNTNVSPRRSSRSNSGSYTTPRSSRSSGSFGGSRSSSRRGGVRR